MITISKITYPNINNTAVKSKNSNQQISHKNFSESFLRPEISFCGAEAVLKKSLIKKLSNRIASKMLEELEGAFIHRREYSAEGTLLRERFSGVENPKIARKVVEYLPNSRNIEQNYEEKGFVTSIREKINDSVISERAFLNGKLIQEIFYDKNNPNVMRKMVEYQTSNRISEKTMDKYGVVEQTKEIYGNIIQTTKTYNFLWNPKTNKYRFSFVGLKSIRNKFNNELREEYLTQRSGGRGSYIYKTRNIKPDKTIEDMYYNEEGMAIYCETKEIDGGSTFVSADRIKNDGVDASFSGYQLSDGKVYIGKN